MSWELRGLDITLPADEDLSSDQYRIVVQDATSGKIRRPNAATDIPFGILQNAPNAADKEAVVRQLGSGFSKVQLGATLAIGAIIAMEYVGAADAGKAQAAIATQYPVGTLVAGGDEDELGVVSLCPLTVKA